MPKVGRQGIAAHVPDPPPTSTKVAQALSAIQNDSALDPATQKALAEVVQALSS
jgi:hypothetical protein